MKGAYVMILWFVLLLCVCSTRPTEEITGPVSRPASLGDSVNVKEYGALGDGRHNDTAAFRSALAALGPSGGVIQVPAGTYILVPSSGTPDRAIDLSARTNVTFIGAGISNTTLQMAAGTYRGDTHLVYLLESSDIEFHDLSLDGNRLNASFADEQNHCVEVWRGSKNIVFQGVLFHRCRGDGIRLIGPSTSTASWTENVLIENSRFEDNGRSGIAVQRGVRELKILNNTFDRISDQSIDMEPTGAAGGLAPMNIVIEGNVIRHRTGTWAVAIGGVSSDDVIHRVEFNGNRVENGAVVFGKADSLMVRDNTIIGDPLHSALRLARNTTNVLVTGNVISGTGGGEEGLLQVVAYNDAHPSHVSVSDNVITTSAGQTGIYIRDALGDVEIRGNRIHGGGVNSGIHIASVVTTGKERVRFSVEDNEISNFASGIHFSTREDAFDEVTIRFNSINYDADKINSGRKIGILFDKTGPYQRFATVSNNEFGAGIINDVFERID